ncbi:MAG: FtsW/RodA/SpoVE family cell cycle protein [Tannerella sp.]|jgi:cell division protein FtsW|nr:FtsW/RodA/SpoVE family cell cycle protein [Tannerella sp.]
MKTKTDIVKIIFRGDKAVWFIFLLLAGLSLILVFSATSTIAFAHSAKNAGNIWAPFIRHAKMLGGGALLILLLSHIHYRYFPMVALFLVLPAALATLIATFFVGVNVNDASRFISLFGIQFQPSEVGKLACIVYVAFLLSRRRDFSSERKLFKWILLAVLPVCGLIFPFNLSTAVLLGGVCFLMMFIGQIPYRLLGKLLFWLTVLAAVFVFALAVTPEETVKKYFPRALTWKKRIDTFFGSRPKVDDKTYFIPSDDEYQISHAKAAIASSGLFWGKGPGRSEQRDYLPQAYSDFIYSISIEELGILLGGLGLLLLYIMLMVRVGVIARRCRGLFPKYLVIGCGLIIVVQALVHMAVNVGLMPVTGQPLPLISRGGTSTLLTCAYIGMILSVSHYGAEPDEPDGGDTEEEDLPEEMEPDSEINPIFAAESIVSEE